MELDDRVILTGFDGSAVASDLGNLKIQDELVQHRSKQNAGDFSNSNGECTKNETQQAYDEKPKIKQSQENMQIYRTDLPEAKEIFLPRLAGSSYSASPDNKSQDEKEQTLRLPEIRMVPSKFSMLALNRSITDLLDPEMEILNKIKHGPRKRRKKRRDKTVKRSENTRPEDTGFQ